MTGTWCDRCQTRDVPTERVLGKDLCERCAGDTLAWIEGTSKSTRLQNGRPLELVRALVARDGYVTAESFGRLTGKKGRKPYYTLRSLVNRGVIESDRCGPAAELRFFLVEEVCRAAE